jgi:hypothetical protein
MLTASYSHPTTILLGFYKRPTPVLPSKTSRKQANFNFCETRELFSAAACEKIGKTAPLDLAGMYYYNRVQFA